jgi:membrane-associated phospholipid phosphatase
VGAVSRAVAVGAGVVLATLVAWISIEGAMPYDRRALEAVHDVVATDLDDPARVLARGATAWVLVPAAVVAAAILVGRRRWAGLILVVVAAVLVWAVNPALKQLVRRERPTVRAFVEPVSEFSFPSGHATAAMAAAAVVVALTWDTRWRGVGAVGAGLYVLVVGLTQLVLGVHYPSDLIAGYALAIAGVAGAAWAVRYWRVPGVTTPAS